MMKTAHKTTPWHCKQLIGVVQRGFALFRTEIKGTATLSMRIDDSGEFSQADAAFIVTACNAHDDLVNALKLFFAVDGQPSIHGAMPIALREFRDAAKAALAKAGAQ